MPLMRKRGLGEREREPACRQTGGERVGGGHPLDQGPPTRGGGKGDDSAFLVLLVHNSSPLHDAVCWQVGAMVGEHQSKHPRAGPGPPIDLPGWLPPTQVTSDHEEKDEHSTCVCEKMGLTPSSRI
jgi:hypothetical protein